MEVTTLARNWEALSGSVPSNITPSPPYNTYATCNMRTDSTIVLPNYAQKAQLCYPDQVQLGQYSKGPARNAYRMTALPRTADPGSEPWIGATHRVERWLRVKHADYKKETHNR
jgi:hypothetical protein